MSFPPKNSKYFCLLQEKRIYDLKKKNQELEKFKFVLDYKIKELKKQIEPRENDIKAMKEQIQEVTCHDKTCTPS
jgi:chaperonin cofactor prefoldin